ncbi:hypothetical protein Gogos_002504, partial [Gossypium gossypioides]|nr:hypothetical protein [Gossypium gossypioides]
VAERALFLWNNDHIENLIIQNRKVILPIIFPALEKNARNHWNQAEDESKEDETEAKRENTWKRLEELAEKNSEATVETSESMANGSSVLILWEKGETSRWLVRRTRDSKLFFLAFATICGVVSGAIGYGVMQLTSSRNPQLEAQRRQNACPESLRNTLGSSSGKRIRVIDSVAALRGETLTRTPYQRIQPVPKQNAEKKKNNSNDKA